MNETTSAYGIHCGLKSFSFTKFLVSDDSKLQVLSPDASEEELAIAYSSYWSQHTEYHAFETMALARNFFKARCKDFKLHRVSGRTRFYVCPYSDLCTAFAEENLDSPSVRVCFGHCGHNVYIGAERFTVINFAKLRLFCDLFWNYNYNIVWNAQNMMYCFSLWYSPESALHSVNMYDLKAMAIALGKPELLSFKLTGVFHIDVANKEIYRLPMFVRGPCQSPVPKTHPILNALAANGFIVQAEPLQVYMVDNDAEQATEGSAESSGNCSANGNESRSEQASGDSDTSMEDHHHFVAHIPHFNENDENAPLNAVELQALRALNHQLSPEDWKDMYVFTNEITHFAQQYVNHQVTVDRNTEVNDILNHVWHTVEEQRKVRTQSTGGGQPSDDSERLKSFVYDTNIASNSMKSSDWYQKVHTKWRVITPDDESCTYENVTAPFRVDLHSGSMEVGTSKFHGSLPIRRYTSITAPPCGRKEFHGCYEYVFLEETTREICAVYGVNTLLDLDDVRVFRWFEQINKRPEDLIVLTQFLAGLPIEQFMPDDFDFFNELLAKSLNFQPADIIDIQKKRDKLPPKNIARNAAVKRDRYYLQYLATVRNGGNVWGMPIPPNGFVSARVKTMTGMDLKNMEVQRKEMEMDLDEVLKQERKLCSAMKKTVVSKGSQAPPTKAPEPVVVPLTKNQKKKLKKKSKKLIEEGEKSQ